MIKTNKKGFTLIELLAVIVILAIIIVMAVASVGAVLNRMKKNAYVVEANTIVKALKNEAVTDTSILPTEEDGEVSIPLSDIELQNGTKSPYGSEYDESSYVKIKKLSGVGVYEYSIYLVDEEGNGIGTETIPVNIDNVTISSVKNNVEVEEPEPTIGILTPVMTSNTAPSGEAFASSNYPGYPAYFAFTQEYSSETVGTLVEQVFYWNLNETVANAYIGYNFGANNSKHITNVKVYPGFYKCTTDKTVTIKIQGSNDGTSWTDISNSDTIINSSGYIASGEAVYVSYANITCNSSNTYRYVRVKPTSFPGGAAGGAYIIYGGNCSMYMAQIDIYGYID